MEAWATGVSKIPGNRACNRTFYIGIDGQVGNMMEFGYIARNEQQAANDGQAHAHLTFTLLLGMSKPHGDLLTLRLIVPESRGMERVLNLGTWYARRRGLPLVSERHVIHQIQIHYMD